VVSVVMFSIVFVVLVLVLFSMVCLCRLLGSVVNVLFVVVVVKDVLVF